MCYNNHMTRSRAKLDQLEACVDSVMLIKSRRTSLYTLILINTKRAYMKAKTQQDSIWYIPRVTITTVYFISIQPVKYPIRLVIILFGQDWSKHESVTNTLYAFVYYYYLAKYRLTYISSMGPSSQTGDWGKILLQYSLAVVTRFSWKAVVTRLSWKAVT